MKIDKNTNVQECVHKGFSCNKALRTA